MKQALQYLAIGFLATCGPAVWAAKNNINSRPIPDNTVLRGVRIIDGTGAAPMEDMAIVIHKNRIVAIGRNADVKTPPHAEVLEWKGKTVLPGIIDAHAHLGLVDRIKAENSAGAYNEANVVAELYQFQRYGVTTINSLGANRDLVYDLKKRQSKGLIGGATLLTAGRGIGVPGGAPPLLTADDAVYRPQTEDEAREEVRTMAKQKVDFIKIWVDSLQKTRTPLRPAIYMAVIDEAHKQHIRVAAHIYYLADAKALVNAGVDILAHSVRDAAVDDELISAMKAKGTWYIATLSADESTFVYLDHPDLLQSDFAKFGAEPVLIDKLTDKMYLGKVAADRGTTIKRQDLATASSNLKKMVDAGVKVGFGTDAGAQPVRIPGVMEHRELDLMVTAGLSPMQAIELATSKNADLLQLHERGVIAKGKIADLLVIDGDPLTDIHNTEKIVGVWHNGQMLGDLKTK